MTTTRLKVLLVEDSNDDAFFLLREVGKGGWAVDSTRVDRRETLAAALAATRWDVVLTDYVIPGFGGMEAISDVRAVDPDVPILMISGQMGEERAVEAMRAGASDYLVKGHWHRLVPAIRRELREAASRRARRKADEGLKRQHRRLQALRAIDVAIASSADVRVPLDVVLDATTRELGVDAACVLRLNPDDQKLEHVARKGFHTAALRHTHLGFGTGFAGQAALDRRTIFVPDLAAAAGGFGQSPGMAEEGFLAYAAAPLVARGHVCGVLEVFHRRRLDDSDEWRDFLETLAGQAAIALDNASMYEGLRQTNLQLTVAYDATIEGWARALELRDLETKGHTRRVTEMTVRLARALGIGSDALVHMRRGALLHDVGKMAIPDGILLKPGGLTEEERNVMRRHTTIARDMLTAIPFLRPSLEIPYGHHERWDGTGYPRGLAGAGIPLAARLFAVVDVWDSLRSARPYKEPWPDDRVRAHLKGQAGRHFDPDILAAFLDLPWPEPDEQAAHAEPVSD